MSPLLALGLATALGAAVRGNWSPCGESLQAQIHPLGERRRGNVWGVTIVAFTIGSVFGGAAVTALMGLFGAAALGGEPTSIWLAASAALAAGVLDLTPLRPWTPRRQVNEDWIGRYRGWVYGAGFGLQLGVGFAVFVMSWGYWAMLLISFMTASPAAGALTGAVFGLGRGLLLYLSRTNTTPESLGRFHERMMRYKRPTFMATAMMMVIVALTSLI